jgi:predicted ribonuclease YlaK
MSKQLLFADTNVFLHCTFFTDVDWRTLVAGEDAVLTICSAVLSELEKKKFADPSRRIRDRAKGVVRKIGELVENDQPFRFRQGCWLWVTCRSPLIDLESLGLSKHVVDDVILASALEQRDRGSDVVIVSTDTGMRLKGNTHRVRTVRVPDDWMLPDEMDDHERELRALRKQVAELAAASPNLKLTFGGHTVAEYVLKRTKPLTPEAIK